jgi:hypothetical protein
VPEQVGTNCDWLQASGLMDHSVGLCKDGTLWEWGTVATLGRGGSARLVPEPEQIDPGHDWISVANGGAHSLALRKDGTLWGWADNSMAQLGNGGGPNPTNLVQVGTNQDWAVANCGWMSSLGLRTDGTLWAWGRLTSFGNGIQTVNNFSVPTQVSAETNWSGAAVEFFGTRAWTRSGDFCLLSPTSSEGSGAGWLSVAIISNSAPDKAASAFCGRWKLYQVRPDGTLWGKDDASAPGPTTPAGGWRRVGKRSDWVSLWGSGGAALGLTADGTVWAWGIDHGQEPMMDFASKLRRLQERTVSVFGTPPAAKGSYSTMPFQKEPRPLMKLISGGARAGTSLGVEGSTNSTR